MKDNSHKNVNIISENSCSIKTWPEDERPREKLVKFGPEYLSNAELLAVIIGTGINTGKYSQSAIDLAKTIILRFDSLKNLINTSFNELISISGMGISKAAKIIAVFELGKRALSVQNGNNIKFRCSEEVANYYIPLMKDLKKEQFKVILLDIKNKIIKDILISQGSLTASIVHPREVLKPAIQASAASVIFIHNHPSGDPEPSSDDIEVTNRLCRSCSILGINLLDHIIVAENGYYSFKQKDLI
ncbi:MAG: DNA repair protein RadC [Actinobacteria bacterium]|nr:DNA repair protein RadC [Actinomycetota bacterium]